jgi:hypothetical protein
MRKKPEPCGSGFTVGWFARIKLCSFACAAPGATAREHLVGRGHPPYTRFPRRCGADVWSNL